MAATDVTVPGTAKDRSASWAGSIVPVAVTVWRTVPEVAATSVVAADVLDADERVIVQIVTPAATARTITTGTIRRRLRHRKPDSAADATDFHLACSPVRPATKGRSLRVSAANLRPPWTDAGSGL